MITWIEGRPPEVRAGMLVELDDGTRHLVGDINEQGGCCDCCTIDYHFPANIKRYAVVYEK